jgi:hypothetical protein
MRTRLAICALALAACQPLYGGRSEVLKNPPKQPIPAVKPEPIAYVEECTFDFHSRPATKHRTAQPQVVASASQVLTRAEAAPETPELGDLVTSSIVSYSRALAADPYDPEATLGLARAYDRVRHKGCALALLKRLGALADLPQFASAARPVARSVDDHATWFKGYRREALAALGLP